jgi:hypothetical protein
LRCEKALFRAGYYNRLFLHAKRKIENWLRFWTPKCKLGRQMWTATTMMCDARLGQCARYWVWLADFTLAGMMDSEEAGELRIVGRRKCAERKSLDLGLTIYYL